MCFGRFILLIGSVYSGIYIRHRFQFIVVVVTLVDKEVPLEDARSCTTTVRGDVDYIRKKYFTGSAQPCLLGATGIGR